MCPLGIQTCVHHAWQMFHYILLSPGLGDNNFIQKEIYLKSFAKLGQEFN